jgi:glucosamine--fructose-6-phosphate aminotransferase (isomerizing)
VASQSSVKREILSQPEVWAATWRGLQDSRDRLGALLFSQCWDAVFFAGCGSTHYLALAAANLHQQMTGQRTRAFPSSEMTLFPAAAYPDIGLQTNLLVALSRSGETTETLRAVEQHHERQMPVLAITTEGDSSLARQSEAVFVAEAAREESVPQTRSFTAMYLATQFVAGLVADDKAFLAALERLPSEGQEVLERSREPVAEVGGMGWQRIIFLGSGPYYGLACEGMLKATEMGLDWAEAYHFYEFRHGPISLVDDSTLVVGLLSDTGTEDEQAVLREVRELGGQTLAIGERSRGTDATAYAVPLETGLSELARAPLYVLPLQLLAYQRAQARGIDPDRPRHLQKAVVLAGA